MTRTTLWLIKQALGLGMNPSGGAGPSKGMVSAAMTTKAPKSVMMRQPASVSDVISPSSAPGSKQPAGRQAQQSGYN